MVQQNKEYIRETDDRRKDEIMELHIDMTLGNTSCAKIGEKMQSMRDHARKLAHDYL